MSIIKIEVGFDNLKDLTVGKIKEMSGQINKLEKKNTRLEKENKLLKIKYPKKKRNLESDNYGTKGAQSFIDDLPR